MLEIARAYCNRWERKPTPAEIAYALAFVLRVDTEDYVSDLEHGKLWDIDAE